MDYKPEESLGRWISIIDRCASRFARRRLRPHGIGKNHLFFLGTLVREGDDISQEELAARLHMDRGATTRSLSTLEREGYVRRLANRGDARARRILLTAKARRRWPRIVEDLQSWNRVLTEGFTAAQRKEVGLLLSRMATNAMESVERDRGPCPSKHGRAKHLWILLAAILFFAARGTRAETLHLGASQGPNEASQQEVTLAKAAGADTLMTLPRVLVLAERHSLAARVAPFDSLQAQAEIRGATASWWPRIDADASYTVRDNPVEAVFGSERFPFAQKSNAAYGIHLKETLFNGGRRKLSVEAARQSAKASEASSWASIRQAQLDALSAYLQVLRLQDQTAVLRQRHAAVSAHRKVAQDLYDQGLVARNDLLETQVREREIDDAVQELKDARVSATQDLNRILGREISAELSLPDSLGPAPMLDASCDGLIRAASDQNPHLQTLRARLQEARTRERLAHREYWPEIYLSLGHSYEENRYMAYPHVNAVVAGMSWNLFEGGARKAKIAKAQAEIARATQGLKDVSRGVSVAVDSAWRQWKQSLREEATAQDNVRAARTNLQIVEDQYRSGLARSSDVLDAEVLLADSRYTVITRHYQSYWNQARLLVTAGEDPAEFYADVARRGAH